MGTGESPFLVAKQLGLDQLFRDGATIHRDEGRALALRLGMQRAGYELLARAALTADHDRRIGSGHPGNQAAQGSGLVTVAEHEVIVLGNQLQVPAAQVRHATGAPKRNMDTQRVERQCVVIKKPFGYELGHTGLLQHWLGQGHHPLDTGTVDQRLDRFQAVEMMRAQPQHPQIASR